MLSNRGTTLQDTTFWLLSAATVGAVPRQHVLCFEVIRVEDDRPRFTDPFARVDARTGPEDRRPGAMVFWRRCFDAYERRVWS